MPRQRIYTDSVEESINQVYEWGHSIEGMPLVNDYHKDRQAAQILTNTDWLTARQRVDEIRDRIRGKFVIEIGAGVGFTAIEMCKSAEQVVAIEADPSWSWVFTKHLYFYKPHNLIWMFGDARLIRDMAMFQPRHEVAVIFTRSGLEEMQTIGRMFADEVIMYHQEYPE